MTSAIIQHGSNFVVALVNLLDSDGNVIDTEAHLHIKDSSGAEIRLTRVDDQITYAAPSTDPFSGDDVSNKYEAIITATAVSSYKYWWHFPDIKFVTQGSTFRIVGPVLTEPT